MGTSTSVQARDTAGRFAPTHRDEPETSLTGPSQTGADWSQPDLWVGTDDDGLYSDDNFDFDAKLAPWPVAKACDAPF